MKISLLKHCKPLLLVAVMILPVLISPIVFMSKVRAASDYNIVGLGDSIMMGYGVSDSENFFSLVKNNLKSRFSSQANVVGENLGIDGADSTALLFKLNRDSGYIESIKNAELIEVNIGGNDGLLYLTGYIMEQLGLNDDVETLITAELEKQGTTYDAFITDTTAAMNEKYPGGLTDAELDMLIQEKIAAMDIDFFSLFEGSTTDILGLDYSQVSSKITESVNQFSKAGGNWEQIVARIKSLNPQADVIVTTTFNPYKSISSILNLIGSNMSTTVDIISDGVNGKISSYASTGKYTINDIEPTFSSVGGMLLTGIVNSDPHPNANGHKMIYTLQKTALSKLSVKVVVPPVETQPNTEETPDVNDGNNSGDTSTDTTTETPSTSTCKARVTTINNLMSRIVDRGSKQLAVINKTYNELRDYYESSDATINDYAAKIESITTKQTEAQVSVQSLSQYESLDCEGSDPKGQLDVFLGTAQIEYDKLKIYKDSISELLSSIKLAAYSDNLVGVINYGV